MPIQSDLAHLARLIERAITVKKSRLRAANTEEVKAALESVRVAGFDKAPADWGDRVPKDKTGPLDNLRRAFGLSQREAEIVLIAVGPELDPRLRRVYGFLHDNLTMDRPTVGMALELLYATSAERVKARALFAADGPLRFFRLIVVGGAPSEPCGTRSSWRPSAWCAPPRVKRGSTTRWRARREWPSPACRSQR